MPRLRELKTSVISLAVRYAKTNSGCPPEVKQLAQAFLEASTERSRLRKQLFATSTELALTKLDPALKQLSDATEPYEAVKADRDRLILLITDLEQTLTDFLNTSAEDYDCDATFDRVVIAFADLKKHLK